MTDHYLTPIQIGLIRRAVHQNGLSAKMVAKMFAIPQKWIDLVLAGKLAGSIPVQREESEIDQMQGPIKLRPYLIGRKLVDESEWQWRTYPGEAEGAGIERRDKAREAYDKGEVDLVQARSSRCFFLYSIPRKLVDPKRRPYFSVIHGDP